MNRMIFFFCIVFLSLILTHCNYGPANAVIEPVHVITDSSLGAVQGVVVRDRFIYAYGDDRSSGQSTGIIREYTLNLRHTGRLVTLTRNGISIIPHPTGLTWHPEWGTFIGNTVRRKGTILRIDWERAWADANLDNAVLDIIEDDAASNGSRPVFVTMDGKTFLASADYMGFSPDLRLYDISAMLKTGKTSSKEVTVHRLDCGQYTQNLHWNSEKGHLTFIRNKWPYAWPYRGYHLETIRLSEAVAAGFVSHPSAVVSSVYFDDKGELEGWNPVDETVSVFAVNQKVKNLFTARIKLVNP